MNTPIKSQLKFNKQLLDSYESDDYNTPNSTFDKHTPLAPRKLVIKLLSCDCCGEEYQECRCDVLGHYDRLPPIEEPQYKFSPIEKYKKKRKIMVSQEFVESQRRADGVLSRFDEQDDYSMLLEEMFGRALDSDKENCMYLNEEEFKNENLRLTKARKLNNYLEGVDEPLRLAILSRLF